MQIKLFILFFVFTFFQFGFIEVVFGAPGGQRHSSPPRPARPAGMQDNHSSGSYGSSSPTRQGSQPVFSNGRPINAQNYARGQRDQQLVHTAVGAATVAYGTGATAVGAGKVVKGIFSGNRAERHDGYQTAASGVFGACAGAAVCLMQGTRAVNNHIRAHSPQAASNRYQSNVNASLAASAQHHH
jgi:hypothetical protein